MIGASHTLMGSVSYSLKTSPAISIDSSSVGITQKSVVMMDATHAIVTYIYMVGGNSYVYACGLTINPDNTITAGTPLLVNNYVNRTTHIANINSNRAIMIYGTFNSCKVQVLSFNPATMSVAMVGAALTIPIGSGVAEFGWITKLDNTRFVTTYMDVSGNTASFITTYNSVGDTLSGGVGVSFSTSANWMVAYDAVAIDSSHVITLVRLGPSFLIYTRCLTISGTTINLGGFVSVTSSLGGSGVMSNIGIVAMDSGHALSAWQDTSVSYGSNSLGRVCNFDFSGSTITPHYPYISTLEGGTGTVTLASLSSVEAISCCNGKAVLVKLNGSDVSSYGIPKYCYTDGITTTYPTTTNIDSVRAITCFTDSKTLKAMVIYK